MPYAGALAAGQNIIRNCCGEVEHAGAPGAPQIGAEVSGSGVGLSAGDGRGGSPIQVQGKTIVSRLNAALVQPGVTAEIKYDPANPSRLRVLKINAESSATEDTSSRLEELEELRQKNLITELEYRQKREEILKSL